MLKFKEYLYMNRLTRKEFAKHIGYSTTYLDRIASGERLPGDGLALIIEKATNGAVPVSSWPPKEKKFRRKRKAVSEVKPEESKEETNE